MIVLKWLFLMLDPFDLGFPWKLGYQDAATPMKKEIMDMMTTY